MKKLFNCTIVFAVAALVLYGASGRLGSRHEADLQQSIARKIIRFHVIANSDSDADQDLKMQVKEEVVSSMEPMLADVQSVEEAREAILLHIDDIEQIAQKALEERGCSEPVTAQLTQCHFPVKTYGEFTFPDGEYEALRIVIGEGQGKNWWCVMYPRLCFVDSLYTVVPEDSKKELKARLTDEEYEEILQGQKKVKVRWKFLEWLGID